MVHPMRSSWNMWEPTWVSRSRCWLLAGERLGHVCMVPEPVGSTHLRFDDARVIKEVCMWLPNIVRDHREGPGGPPSGATGPRGLHGPSVGGDQPQVGWCAPPQGPKAPRVWGGGASTLLGGQVSPSPPLAATLDGFWGCRTPWGGNPRGGAAPSLSPIYS